MGDYIYGVYSIACFVVAAVLILWVRYRIRKDHYEQRYPNGKKSIFISPQYKCKFARTEDQINNLVEDGYEYVCDFEGRKVFRKKA